MKTEIKKLPDSEIMIAGEITNEDFETYRTKAVAVLIKDFELPGFRKGHVPESKFLEKVPEMVILEEMAGMAINEAYPKIVAEQKLDPIGRPEVSITKIAKGSPLCFTIKTAFVPEIKLPEYKKVAKEIMGVAEPVYVDEKDIDDAILDIRKMRAPKTNLQPTTDNKENAEQKTPNTPTIEPVLPELTDDFVKTLGKFENVTDFKLKLTENIKTEKERAAREKSRVKLLDALVEKTKIDLPKVIVEEEQNKLIFQLRHDIEQMGLKFDEYLKNVKKTEDDIKTEWRGEAEKRAKIQFIVTKIGLEENISPSDDELNQEVKHLIEHNKEADEPRARLYLASLITNQKVMEFLENQK